MRSERISPSRSIFSITGRPDDPAGTTGKNSSPAQSAARAITIVSPSPKRCAQ
ncbi:MAG: hypothetical protein Q8M47_06935 [Devosia sp.]|nr:hypothetical protein [Devosia sp.]